MDARVSVSRAREALGEVLSAAVRRHVPVTIERRDERAVLIGLDDLDGLLTPYEFHPETFFEGEAVTLWLPEFGLYGRGRTYDEAQEDLLEEVRAYMSDYLEDSAAYLNAPNRAHHFPHVVRALIADARGSLGEVLFAPPRDDSQPDAAEERAATAV
jgi:hypothetical protein